MKAIHQTSDVAPARSLLVALALLLLAAAAAPGAARACAGDCDGDGRVSAAEIVGVVAGDCPDGFEEGGPAERLDAAIGNVFAGCAGPPRNWQVALDASEIGWMMSGWGTGDGAVWVVGGGAFDGRILRFENGEFSEVELEIPFLPLLNWVHGTSATDVFVGGNEGTILHFDGETWVQQEVPVLDPVWGLWAEAPYDVWAVGGNSVLGNEPFVLHYDGESWTRMQIPELVRPGVRAFFKVWGAGPDDVWAVGQNGAVLHWDGVGFTEFGVGVSQDLIGIWGNGPDDITVVGGRGTAEIAHFDGVSWSSAPPSRYRGLNGIWTRRPDVAHAVGIAGTVLRVDPRTLDVLEEIPVPTDLELHAVFGDESGQLLAFGANFEFPERGVVLIRGLTDDD